MQPNNMELKCALHDKKLELDSSFFSHQFITNVVELLELGDMDLELCSIKWLLKFRNAIIEVDLELWSIKWLLNFGNVMMEVESLELKWF